MAAIFFKTFYFIFGVSLISNVVLASDVQQSDCYTYTCIYSLSNYFPI